MQQAAEAASLEQAMMHRGIAFRPRCGPINLVAILRRLHRRWRIHARFEGIAAALCDLRFNPFQFQIESGR
jgi:hypothetical protein